MGTRIKTPISHDHLIKGICMCLKNALNLFNSANILHHEKQYQACIPLSILSLEESNKGLIFLKNHTFQQDLSIDTWALLNDHNSKLIAPQLHRLSDNARMKKFIKEYSKAKGIDPTIPGNSPMMELETRDIAKIGFHRYFNPLKMYCMYTDWKELDNRWVGFDHLNAINQEILARFTLACSYDILFVEFITQCKVCSKSPKLYRDIEEKITTWLKPIFERDYGDPTPPASHYIMLNQAKQLEKNVVPLFDILKSKLVIKFLQEKDHLRDELSFKSKNTKYSEKYIYDLLEKLFCLEKHSK